MEYCGLRADDAIGGTFLLCSHKRMLYFSEALHIIKGKLTNILLACLFCFIKMFRIDIIGEAL